MGQVHDQGWKLRDTLLDQKWIWLQSFDDHQEFLLTDKNITSFARIFCM